jgi:ATP-dependent helicase HrpA
VEIPLDAWPLDAIPAHLRPRIEVVGNDRKTIGAGRDLAALRQKLEQVQTQPAPDDSAWTRVAKQWERANITTWNFGDLPARILVSETGPVPVYAWPGLAVEKETISLRLFRTEDSARSASLGGIQKLVELALAKDFAWLHRDLRALHRFDALAANLCPLEELQERAYENLQRHLLPAEVFWPLTEAQFLKAVQATRLALPGSAQTLVDQVGAILRARREIELRCGSAPVLPSARPKTLTDLSQLNLATQDAAKPANLGAEELAALLPRNFLAEIPFPQLAQVPRYLKALATRLERAKLNPVKDRERAALVAPYLAKLKTLREHPPKSIEARRQLEAFRWLVEEYKVSVFAQEIGTAIPVSPKRLDEQLQRLGG